MEENKKIIVMNINGFCKTIYIFIVRKRENQSEVSCTATARD